MVENPGGSRARVLEAIEARRRGVERYLADKRPVNSRLTFISVTSSCLAAALTVGPAVGGETFAQTVQHGLNLNSTATVWRALCFVAVIISVTAAIATNLGKSSDLAARIAAAETANGALDGLQMRLQVGLPVAEAAQQYQEIVTRVPWIQVSDGPGGLDDTETQGRRLRLAAPYLLGTAAVGAIVVVVTIGGLLAGLANAAPSIPQGRLPSSSSPPTSPGLSSTATEAANPQSTAVSPEPAVYSGHTPDGIGIAVAIDSGKAIAYICDGNSLEAWLQGTTAGNQVTVNGKNGSLTGTILDGSGGSQLGIMATIKGRQYQTMIARANAPAGVYEAKIASPNIRIGWAVLKGGAQLGVENDEGIEVPAPPLSLKDGSFKLNGRTYHATLKTSPDTVAVSQ